MIAQPRRVWTGDVGRWLLVAAVVMMVAGASTFRTARTRRFGVGSPRGAC